MFSARLSLAAASPSTALCAIKCLQRKHNADDDDDRHDCRQNPVKQALSGRRLGSWRFKLKARLHSKGICGSPKVWNWRQRRGLIASGRRGRCGRCARRYRRWNSWGSQDRGRYCCPRHCLFSDPFRMHWRLPGLWLLWRHIEVERFIHHRLVTIHFPPCGASLESHHAPAFGVRAVPPLARYFRYQAPTTQAHRSQQP